MSTLLETFEAIKDPNLSKDQLEDYHTQLSMLSAQMNIECADLEKEEALFFLANTTVETSDISIKRKWKVTDSGQRLILLNRYLKAMSKVLRSLQSRLYEKY